MKIGIVCPYSFDGPGGVQAHVLGLAGWLIQQGHEVGVLAPGVPADDWLSRNGVPDEAFTSSGYSVPLRFNGSVARVSIDPLTYERVGRWIDEGDFDVLHLHEPITPSIAPLALHQSTCPVYVTFHTALPRSRALWLSGKLFPYLLERIDVATSVSWVAHDVAWRHLGIDSEVTGNGIRVADHRFPELQQQGRWRGGDHPRITFVGRYSEPRKGFQVLMDALPAIREVHPDVEVAVVGGGHPVDDPSVRLLGRLNDPDRDRLLAQSDVYVAPNLGRESFGIILLEALAAGAPVVASDLTAFRDVISDEQGPVGLLFPVGDHRKLAQQVLASLERPASETAERALAVATRFDWDNLGATIVEGYENAGRRYAARTEPLPPGFGHRAGTGFGWRKMLPGRRGGHVG